MKSFDTSLDDSIQAELKKRAATATRIKILGFVCVIAILARLFVKNPPPPEKAVHVKKEVKVLPGMLARLPVSERVKLNSEMLAKLQDADKNKKSPDQLFDAYAQIPTDKKNNNVDKFVYEKSVPTKIVYHETQIIKIDDKKMVVQLKSGGYLKVQDANKNGEITVITIDGSMAAAIPSSLILTTLQNTKDWKEPIPTGYKELRPAKGITIQVAEHIAPRITIFKEKQNAS